MPLAAVIQRHKKVKLLCNPNCRKDIVHPMHMGFQRDFLFQYRQPAFIPEILFKIPGGICLPFPLLTASLPLRLLLFLPILFRLKQFFPQHPGNGHSGGGHFSLSRIIYFGILTESHFHGGRCQHCQIIDSPSLRLYKSELSSYHIGTARANHSGRDPCPHRIVKCRIH